MDGNRQPKNQTWHLPNWKTSSFLGINTSLGFGSSNLLGLLGRSAPPGLPHWVAEHKNLSTLQSTAREHAVILFSSKTTEAGWRRPLALQRGRRRRRRVQRRQRTAMLWSTGPSRHSGKATASPTMLSTLWCHYLDTYFRSGKMYKYDI